MRKQVQNSKSPIRQAQGLRKVESWLARRRWVVWVEFGALALFILLPLMRPGYILTLDMIFTPTLRMPVEVNNSYLFYGLLHWLNYVLPSQVIQKLLLFGILVLSGVGAYRLVIKLSSCQVFKLAGSESESDELSAFNFQLSTAVWGAYFAGIFYMVNPFVYSRFMAGHYLVLLGYALMPFFTIALWRFLDGLGGDRVEGIGYRGASGIKTRFLGALKPGFLDGLGEGRGLDKESANPIPYTLYPLVGWAVLISLISIHSIGFMVLLSLVGAVVWSVSRRSLEYSKRLLGYGLVYRPPPRYFRSHSGLHGWPPI